MFFATNHQYSHPLITSKERLTKNKFFIITVIQSLKITITVLFTSQQIIFINAGGPVNITKVKTPNFSEGLAHCLKIISVSNILRGFAS